MADSMVLKEYLLALGFKIDEKSVKTFDQGIGKLDLGAAGLAKKMLGAAVAAQALVTVFANSMEKLYYASRRTGSTVDNIQALEYAGRGIGLSGEQMRGALEGMARALRAQPGLVGVLKDLGVTVEGRDKADVLTDLVTQLNKMPFYTAQQYAGLFGIDADELFMLQEGLVDMKRLREERKKMNEEAGFDAAKAAEEAKNYSNAIRQVTERLSLLKDIVANSMMPYFKDFTAITIRALDALNKWLGTAKPAGQQVQGAVDANKQGASALWEFTKRSWGFLTTGKVPTNGSNSTQAAPSGAGGAGSLFSVLESRYGLPPGLLDKMWNQESSRGKNMLSPAGAKGHFGFMDATAKEMGLKDPNDLQESARAAAEYMAKLMSRYGGDIQKALAAYNWGMGNVDRQGMANAPWETQKYVRDISGRSIEVQQNNTFTIQSPDPESAGRAVMRDLGSANSQLTRNLAGSVQ